MSGESRQQVLDLTVQAYWAGRFDEGRQACEWILSHPDLSDQDRDLTRRNQVFYSRSLNQLAPSTRFEDVSIAVEPGWTCFNPSIASADGEVRMIVRSSNYRVENGEYLTVDGGPVRTRNYLAELGDDLRITSVRPLADSIADASRNEFPVRGFEDCRLFKWGIGWFASATARDLNPAGICQQVLLHVGDEGFDGLWPLSNPASGYHEKNWMPVEFNGSLMFIYSVSPLAVVQFDPVSEGVSIAGESEAPAALSAARGGSQLVRLGDGWLSVIHESITFEDGTRSYPHRFVWFNATLNPVYFSEQFHFERHGIEYCTGLAAIDGQLVASFGSDDSSARLAIMDEPEVVALLRPAIDLETFDLGPLLAAAAEIATDADGDQVPADQRPADSEGDAVTSVVSADPAADVLEELPTDTVPTFATWAPSPSDAGLLVALAAEPGASFSAPEQPSSAVEPDSVATGGPLGHVDGLTHGNQAARATTYTPLRRPVRIVSTTISGNSRDHIGDALRSVVDWVDACVLIDTGITDDTIEVARQIAGDKLQVRSFPWNDSFSDARNFALIAATQTGADWSVTLDTDERLSVEPEVLRTFLEETEAGLIHLRYQDGSYGKERFFRLPARGGFSGPTHEAFMGDVLVLDAPSGHFREEPKTEEDYQRKFDRDISILSRHVVDHPDDPRWRYYLADSLQNAGRLQEAVEQFQACWDLNGWDEESAWSMYRAAECQIALGDLDAAIQSCANGLVRHPGVAELPWLASWACFRKGEMRRAIAWARMSCALGSVEGIGDSFHRLGFTNPRGRFEGPYDVLRFALRELGEDDAADAAEYLFDEALAMRGSSREQEQELETN
jgi:tetratricopeptide (TPR) repeat protein